VSSTGRAVAAFLDTEFGRVIMYRGAQLAAGKYTPISVSIIAVLVVVVYATLFHNYRVNTNIDIPWSLSFSYNLCVKGIETDASFGVQFPVGQGGTVAFGKFAAMIQCATLAPLNWSLVAANVLSVAGVVVSIAVIFAFLVGEGFSRFGAFRRSPARTAIFVGRPQLPHL
jgi:hypothetical protein